MSGQARPVLAGIQLYSVGVCFASACAPREATPEEVERCVNDLHWTGLSHGWTISSENFHTGQTNPCPCNSDPSRLHWLLAC